MKPSPDDVFVIGVGRTAFTRAEELSVRTLGGQAIAQALADAGVDHTDIQSACFANAGQGALEGQHMIRGQIVLRDAGVQGIPVINVENACASASTALHLATMTLRTGEADVALAVGAERLVTGDNAASKNFFAGALDVASDLACGAGSDRSVFMDIYAALATGHMDRFGTTREQLAAVTAKNRSHAVHNPLAQYRDAMTVEQVLAAREVIWPLTLPMCAPLGNGAAAAVVCSGRVLHRFADASPVRIAAIALGSGRDRAAEDDAHHITRLLSQQAYERAGIGPEDVSLAEVHDATAAGEIIQTECLGLVAPGDGGPMAAAGETALGGRIPVNLSGGLECNGHPIGATGLAQVHEVVTQLRGRAGARQVAGARVGLVENGGGYLGVEEAAACVALFETWGAA